MGIWNNFKTGLKGKPKQEVMVTRKIGKVTETIPYSWVEKEHYEKERNTQLLNKARTEGLRKAKTSVQQPQRSGGFLGSVAGVLRGTPEQQAKARAYLNSNSISKSTMGGSSAKKDQEFLKKLMRS